MGGLQLPFPAEAGCLRSLSSTPCLPGKGAKDKKRKKDKKEKKCAPEMDCETRGWLEFLRLPPGALHSFLSGQGSNPERMNEIHAPRTGRKTESADPWTAQESFWTAK